MDSEEISVKIFEMYEEFKTSHTKRIDYTDVYGLICDIVDLIDKEDE